MCICKQLSPADQTVLHNLVEIIVKKNELLKLLDRIDKNMDMPPKNKTENKREKIKRYNPQMLHTGYTIDQIEMAAKPDGQYVLYEDHQKIIAELKEELTDKQN